MATTIGTANDPIWFRPRQPVWVRAFNAGSAGLGCLGVRWPRVDAEALLANARRKAGLADFGDGRFLEGFRILVDDLNAQTDLHPFGRLMFVIQVGMALVNRLKIQDDLKRHPEILDIPVRRPIFITGLPRSGTTFLHRLMSCDPAGRPLLFWEAYEPSPPPEPATYQTDPRIRRAALRVAILDRLSPGLASAHEFQAEEPDEDNQFYLHDFRSEAFPFLFGVPAYARWLRADDLGGLHEYARIQMQHLSWKVRGDYWVMKAPMHLLWLPRLLEVFPDASVIVTHRDPRRTIPSLCSLMTEFRSMVTDRVDLRRLAAGIIETMAVVPERMMEARTTLDPARFFDVSYERLIADPIATVHAACDRFGYDFTPEYEAKARRHLAEHPQHRRGVHRYALEDFGLDEAADRPFAAYRAWLVNRGLLTGR
jgi:hypothetical protein